LAFGSTLAILIDQRKNLPVLQPGSLFQVSLKRNRSHEEMVRARRIVPYQLNLRQVI
jgi:hypothetical protein